MRTSTAFESELLELIDAPLQHAHYYIVQLRLGEGHRKKSLQLTVERNDDTPMTVDDCTNISNTVSALLDVDDPIEGAYDLEVSSPGLERPLTALEDFKRFEGFTASIELTIARGGRRRFKGEILGVEGDQITIAHGEAEHILPFGEMKAAQIVATEEMIRELLNAADEADEEEDTETTEKSEFKLKKKKGKDHKKTKQTA